MDEAIKVRGSSPLRNRIYVNLQNYTQTLIYRLAMQEESIYVPRPRQRESNTWDIAIKHKDSPVGPRCAREKVSYEPSPFGD